MGFLGAYKFSKHRCHCAGRHIKTTVSDKSLNRVRRFVLYLSQKNLIDIKLNPSEMVPLPLLEKFKVSLQERGLAARTIEIYELSIKTVLPSLKHNPKKYSAAQIQKLICDIAKKKSFSEVKHLTVALKAYLRFLALEQLCPPYLDKAVPTVAEWKLSSLPKYITANEVERVIAACNINTPQGIRDRAIILLLSRLGLRAGDVSNMRLNDIHWGESTLRVRGKCRREDELPVTQEIGDALLRYINKVRPTVDIDKLFLCLNAPYRSFSTSTGISNIVRAALKRADIKHPPSYGAHLLRHSAATNMLRKGATLESISTLLRHKNLDMTRYYAKVDIPQLMRIAQPWPEGVSC